MSTGEDVEHHSIGVLGGGLTDGVLVTLPREPLAQLQTLRQLSVPVVLVGYRRESGLATVYADNLRGAQQATDHLLALGHRRIGFITGDPRTGQSPERLTGYRRSLVRAGLRTDEDLIVEGDFLEESGRLGAHRLLDLPLPPTAIMAANDYMAFGVLAAARERGLEIPDDLSVIGFDDVDAAAHVHPALTTVRHPLHELGHRGVDLLVQMIEEPGAPDATPTIELPSELVIRGTTRRPRPGTG